MTDELPRRTGRLGGILTAAVVGGAAVGVIGWHLRANRAERQDLDVSGFDLRSAPGESEPSRAVAAPAPAQPSSLGMIKADPTFSASRPPARSTTTVSGKAHPPIKMPDVTPPFSLPGQ